MSFPSTDVAFSEELHLLGQSQAIALGVSRRLVMIDDCLDL